MSNLAVWIVLCSVAFLLGVCVAIAPVRLLAIVKRSAEAVEPRTVRTVRMCGVVVALLAVYQLLTVVRAHMY